MKVIKFLIVLCATAITFAIALFIGFAGFKANADTRNTTVTFSAPIDLSGTWHQTPNDSALTNMTAEITPNHIQIMLYSDVVNGSYWDGTFDTSNVKTDSFKVTSISIESTLSQDKTKIFTYQNGILSYEFKMLGKAYIVHLSRGE